LARIYLSETDTAGRSYVAMLTASPSSAARILASLKISVAGFRVIFAFIIGTESRAALFYVLLHAFAKTAAVLRLVGDVPDV
jgi:hypothetical protein